MKFLTADGYSLSTFHSGKQEFVPGTVVKVKGTVKRLEDNPRFGKTVILTRVKVVLDQSSIVTTLPV